MQHLKNGNCFFLKILILQRNIYLFINQSNTLSKVKSFSNITIPLRCKGLLGIKILLFFLASSGKSSEMYEEEHKYT